MEPNIKQEPTNSKLGIFSRDSVFLQQYQTGIVNKGGKPQISLLTGKPSTSFATALPTEQPTQAKQKKLAEPSILGKPRAAAALSKRPAKKQKLTDPSQVQSSAGNLNSAPGQKNLVSIPGSSFGQIPGRIITRPEVHHQNIYYKKWRRLKKVIKDLMFINAAVCDEVIRVEEKVSRAKEERRFLLRKVLYHSAGADGLPVPAKASPGGSTVTKLSALSSGEGSDTPSTKVKSKKKSVDKKKAATTKELLDVMHGKHKKSKSQVTKKLIPPLQLDSMGRPVFPLNLGSLTIHSIGEIVTDRSDFHTPKNIYPEGFCSTRVFASSTGPDKKCLYTCKISDGGKGPIFEIAAEDNSDLVLRSNSPTDCHNLLITAINKSRGANILDLIGEGADFFGLSHPVVQNLIQSCPGSKRCQGYKWIKFEISKSEIAEAILSRESNLDPTISYEAFKLLESKNTTKSSPSVLESSSSLRSLLTSKTASSKGGNSERIKQEH